MSLSSGGQTVPEVDGPQSHDVNQEADKCSATPPTTPPPQRPYYFDFKGDLRLEMPEHQPYIVYSRALSRVSPVFDKMLYGRFAESKAEANGEWLVQLPEDDPTAMPLLLNIIHGRFSDVVHPRTEQELFEITVLTDKYDLTHLLRPWGQSWLMKHCNGARRTHHSRIWIAWEFGNTTIFQAECDYLLKTCSEDPSSAALLDGQGRRLDSYVMLQAVDVIDMLSVQRLDLVRRMLAPVHQLLESLLGLGPASPAKCAAKNPFLLHESKQCEAVLLGSLMKSLVAQELYPLPSAEAFEGSVASLFQTLSALYRNGDAPKGRNPFEFVPVNETQTSIHPLQMNLNYGNEYNRSDHTACNPAPDLKAQIDAVYLNCSFVLSDSHLTHLNTQASKSGCLTKP